MTRMRRAILPVCLALSAAQAWSRGGANPDGLAEHVAAGKWEFAYERSAVFKPMGYTQRRQGSRNICIAGDPRQHLLDWLDRLGCSISQEDWRADGYRLSGECRLPWMPATPVPVDVRLTWAAGRSFRIDIRTREHALLDFTERTLATHRGDCDTP